MARAPASQTSAGNSNAQPAGALSRRGGRRSVWGRGAGPTLRCRVCGGLVLAAPCAWPCLWRDLRGGALRPGAHLPGLATSPPRGVPGGAGWRRVPGPSGGPQWAQLALACASVSHAGFSSRHLCSPVFGAPLSPRCRWVCLCPSDAASEVSERDPSRPLRAAGLGGLRCSVTWVPSVPSLPSGP